MTLRSDGEAIRRIRQYDAGLTQTALAKKAEISRGYLCKIEAGQNCTPPVIHRLAAVLGVPVAAIAKWVSE